MKEGAAPGRPIPSAIAVCVAFAVAAFFALLAPPALLLLFLLTLAVSVLSLLLLLGHVVLLAVDHGYSPMLFRPFSRRFAADLVVCPKARRGRGGAFVRRIPE